MRLTPAFCKLLLGEAASFDDLKSELPDEYEWIKGVKDAMAQAAADAGAESAAVAACAAADAKLHVGEEGCGRLLVTPSPKVQVFESLKLFRQTNAADHDGAMELFEERCLHHAACLPDDEVSSNIAWLSSLSDDALLCGNNFDLYVDSVVQQQLVINTADVFRHIFPAFQAAARQGDDDVAEVTPDYMSHYLGGASSADLQEMFSGSCTRRDFVCLHLSRALSSTSPHIVLLLRLCRRRRIDFGGIHPQVEGFFAWLQQVVLLLRCRCSFFFFVTRLMLAVQP